MASFEALVRRFPTSGYADNALWQAAQPGRRGVPAVQSRRRSRPRAALLSLAGAGISASSLVEAGQCASSRRSTTAAADGSRRRRRRSRRRAAAGAAVAAASPAPLAGEPRDADVDSAHRAARHGARHARARSRSDAIARSGSPGRRGVLRPEGRAADAGADGQGADLSAATSCSKIRVGRHPDSTVRVVLDLEDVVALQRVHALQPVPPGDRLPSARCRAPSRQRQRVAAAPVSTAARAGRCAPAAVSDRGPRRSPVDAVADSPTPSATPPATVAAAPAPHRAARRRRRPSPSAPAANAAGGFSMARQLGLGVSRIVIDPGHGGHDPGRARRRA